MGKIISLPSWAGIGKITIGDATYISGTNYDISNLSITDIKTTIGETSYNLSVLNKREDLMNKYSPYLPANRNINATTKLLYLTEKSAPYSMGDWAGYMHTADAPSYIGSTTVPFYASGAKTFDIVIDYGDNDWSNDSAGLSAYDYVHIWDSNDTSLNSSNWYASAIMTSTNPLVFTASTTLSAVDTNKTFYLWFGNGSGYANGKGWKPDSNSFTITFDYQQPSYLRYCYFDSTGIASELNGLGVYTTNGQTDQSISYSSGNWYYNAPSIKIYYLNTSYTPTVYTGYATFYARKNGGTWTAISTLSNIYIDNPDTLGTHLLPSSLSISEYGNYIDIIAIKQGETLTVGNQGNTTPASSEP